MEQTPFKDIEVTETELAFTEGGRRHAFPRARLPAAFMEWMIAARRAMYDRLEGRGPADFFAAHRSFQIDAVVEVLPPEHPVYRFAFWSRRLFEQDPFHITQTRFPYAYLFHPSEVRDKTPFARR